MENETKGCRQPYIYRSDHHASGLNPPGRGKARLEVAEMAGALGLSGISCAAGRLNQSGHGQCEALAEEDGELGLGHGSLARRHDPLLFRAFPGDEIETVAKQMNNAGLDHRLRKDGGNRVGKPFEAVDEAQRSNLRKAARSALPDGCAERLR